MNFPKPLAAGDGGVGPRCDTGRGWWHQAIRIQAGQGAGGIGVTLRAESRVPGRRRTSRRASRTRNPRGREAPAWSRCPCKSETQTQTDTDTEAPSTNTGLSQAPSGRKKKCLKKKKKSEDTFLEEKKQKKKKKKKEKPEREGRGKESGDATVPPRCPAVLERLGGPSGMHRRAAAVLPGEGPEFGDSERRQARGSGSSPKQVWERGSLAGTAVSSCGER